MLNVYALVFGGLLLLFGRVADHHGRKRIFQLGLVVFTAGSLLAGVASDPLFLVAGRLPVTLPMSSTTRTPYAGVLSSASSSA